MIINNQIKTRRINGKRPPRGGTNDIDENNRRKFEIKSDLITEEEKQSHKKKRKQSYVTEYRKKLIYVCMGPH